MVVFGDHLPTHSLSNLSKKSKNYRSDRFETYSHSQCFFSILSDLIVVGNTTLYISVIYHCRILARTLSFMLEPRFDLAWKEDLSDDSRALMARRFMEVTETLGVLMMAGQPDWRHTDVGVVVVVTPNICKY